MKKTYYFLIVLLALAPPVGVLMYKQVLVPVFLVQAELEQPAEPAKPSAEEQYQIDLDAGLQVFEETYAQEFEHHKKQIERKWGEFKPSSPTVWVSYANQDDVRRSVDYQSGTVQVELLIDEGTHLTDIQSNLDQAVFRFMNATEKEAYQSDVVANRVEQKLADFDSLLEKGTLSDERLFSINDLLSLRLNHSGFTRVGYIGMNDAFTNIVPAAKQGKEIARVSFKIPHSIKHKAAKYAAAVKAAAKKENINPELIYAIIETESSFNPMAKSPVPAYGLMQIVPRTAGKDATSYLFGKAKILAPSYLYKPENNIKIGAAYLHVLQYKYMRKITNPNSRMYCAIAAYNTGASNVGKAFIGKASFNKAVPEINRLSPDKVFARLRDFLPQQETRSYVVKVSRRMKKYI